MVMVKLNDNINNHLKAEMGDVLFFFLISNKLQKGEVCRRRTFLSFAVLFFD